MALKNQQEMSAPKTTPAFEQPDVAPNDVAAAGVETTKAVAKAATTAVGQPRPKASIAFSDLKDVFDTDTVRALSLASPRITAEQGTLNQNRTEDLGKCIVVEPVSWNHRWAMGSGTNDKESKDFFRVSYDNVTVDGESCTVAEYVDSLKAQGFNKAKSSPYGDLWGYIVKKDGKDVPVEERELVLVQMAQISLGAFTSMCVSRGILESKGVVPPASLIEITAKATQNGGGDKFTTLLFKAI